MDRRGLWGFAGGVAVTLAVALAGCDGDGAGGALSDAGAALDGAGGLDASATVDVGAADVALDVAESADVAPEPADGAAPEDSGATDGGAPEDSGAADVWEPDADETDISEAAGGPAPESCAAPCALDGSCVNGVCVPGPVDPCGETCLGGWFCDPVQGACKPSLCALPTTYNNPIQKTSSMQFPDGNQGCDLDGDGEPDNVLGAILKLMGNANQAMELLVLQGEFAILFEPIGFNVDGDPFELRGIPGELYSGNLECSPTAQEAMCDYAVWGVGFEAGPVGVCEPTMVFDEVRVTDGVLHSGTLGQEGGDQVVQITLPLLSQYPVTFPVYQAGIRANVIVDQDGVLQSMTKGVLCGKVPKQAFFDIIDGMPDELFIEAGLSKEAAKGVVEASLDVDINGDGWPDALSSAAWFSTVPGNITATIP